MLAAVDGVEERGFALDVEEGFILAGHGGVSEVLGGGGGADGDGAGAEGAVGGEDEF